MDLHVLEDDKHCMTPITGLIDYRAGEQNRIYPVSFRSLVQVRG
jgi:hypothetical protein